MRAADNNDSKDHNDNDDDNDNSSGGSEDENSDNDILPAGSFAGRRCSALLFRNGRSLAESRAEPRGGTHFHITCLRYTHRYILYCTHCSVSRTRQQPPGVIAGQVLAARSPKQRGLMPCDRSTSRCGCCTFLFSPFHESCIGLHMGRHDGGPTRHQPLHLQRQGKERQWPGASCPRGVVHVWCEAAMLVPPSATPVRHHDTRRLLWRERRPAPERMRQCRQVVEVVVGGSRRECCTIPARYRRGQSVINHQASLTCNLEQMLPIEPRPIISSNRTLAHFYCTPLML